MGTEKTSSAATMTPSQQQHQHHHRSRPPPVPPRPQHLIPVKMMSKYSSMPDILSGWKRDTNPDLLKLSGRGGGGGGVGGGGVYSKRSIVDVIRPDCVKVKTSGGGGGAYPSMLAASNEYLSAAEKTFMSNYRDVRCNGNNYTMMPMRGTKAAGVVVPVDKSHKHNGIGIVIASDGVGNLSYQHYHHPQHHHQQQQQQPRPPPPQQQHVNGKSSKKFSCIPSRSNSKKKQQQQQQQQQKNNEQYIEAGNRYGGKNTNNASANGQISQTSWYVEDMQLSKCEINVNNAPPTMTTGDSAATTAIVPNYGRYANATSVGVVDSRLFHSGSHHSGNGGTKDSVNDVSQQRTYRKQQQQQQQQQRYQQAAQASQPQSPLPRALPRTMMSSPSLSSLPPLPKSLSDASLLWEPTSTNKKVSAYPVSLSPARSSSSSSSSRGSSSSSSGGRRIVHPKVPPPAVPRSNSVSTNGGGGGGSSSSSSDDHPKISAVYVNTSSVVDGTRGVAASLADADTATTISTGEERPLPPPPPPPRKPTSLDMKLSILRKEMHVLRQMDLSLLSQLWSLNESIHEFRQKQELLALNSPYLNSSDEEDSGCYHSNISSQGMVTSNHHNTLGSCSSRSSISTGGRSILRDATKP